MATRVLRTRSRLADTLRVACLVALCGSPAWAQTDRVLADPNPCQPSQLVSSTLYGRSLVALGTDLLVSARGAGCDSVLPGQGVVYRVDPATGTLVRTFANPTPGTGDFGAAIGTLANDLLVGSPSDTVPGLAYRFQGSTGIQLQTFYSPASSAGDQFGAAVVAVGGAALVGAPLDDTGATDAGAAYLFDATTGVLQRAFPNPTPGTRFFGSTVAAIGSNVLVGAPSFSSPGGAVYLLDATTGALRRTFANPSAVASSFGVAVAAAGGVVAVGAPLEAPNGAGAVYLFDSASGALLATVPNPTPDDLDGFGTAVAAMGSSILVGAPGLLSNRDGAAYLVDADPPSPTFGRIRRTFLKAQLDQSISFGSFGAAVTALDTSVVVGAPGYSANLGLSAANVYRFDACGNGVRGAAEQCDDGNLVDGDGCDAGCMLELCGPTPVSGCLRAPAGRASLVLKHKPSIVNSNFQNDHGKDQLVWRWGGGPAFGAADLGSPRTTTSFAVCVYDGSAAPQPRMDVVAPFGGICGRSTCWAPTGTVPLRYKDPLRTPNGVLSVVFGPGGLNASFLRVRGRGSALLQPALPLSTTVTVQMRNTDTGTCWEAVYGAHVRTNTSVLFHATSD